ncbi:MAG: hypothetical protein K2X32_00895 [Phycisphaerales bacterium]|nr:hypothetical protein [Phycisphaerales bacterium]
MATESQLLSVIKDHESDALRRSWMAITIGVITLAFIFAFTYIVCLIFARSLGISTLLLASMIFGVFLVVAWVSALRGVEPGRGRIDTVEEQVGMYKIGYLATGLPINPKNFAEGSATLMMHGPASIVEGWRLRRDRIPTDSRTLQAATSAMQSMLLGSAIAIDSIKPPTASLLLLRTGLAKFERKGSLNLIASIKARELLRPQA